MLLSTEDTLAHRDQASGWTSFSKSPATADGQKTEKRSKPAPCFFDSEEVVRKVLEACPVPITMNRVEDGTIIYESPAARELLGQDKGQEGESVVSRWADPKDRQAYLAQLLEHGRVDRLEIRYRKANGQEFDCALSSRLIDYRGETVIVSNLFDLTASKTADAELTRQRELLHRSDKLSALGELLAGVSHELNNPLSVLVGQAEILQESSNDAKISQRAEKIGKAAKRCARIVKTFLAMARDKPSEHSPVDFNALVDEALELTSYGLRTSGVELSLDLAEDLPVITGDPDQLRQVMTNLIINAHHALSDLRGCRKLRVYTRYRKTSDCVVVKVKDNGPGVPQEVRERIFEPLFTTKEVGTGTGMGLALCHRIVEAHGGTIELESQRGHGASFAIRLPRTGNKQLVSAATPETRTQARGNRVLVVDDEPEVGEIIAEVLEQEGYAVDVVSSAMTALEKTKCKNYDVILSDVRMPDLDGEAFYRVLSDKRPHLIDRLAFVTGDTLSPHVQQFLDASERPFLEKPLTSSEIRDLVALLVRRRLE